MTEKEPSHWPTAVQIGAAALQPSVDYENIGENDTPTERTKNRRIKSTAALFPQKPKIGRRIVAGPLIDAIIWRGRCGSHRRPPSAAIHFTLCRRPSRAEADIAGGPQSVTGRPSRVNAPKRWNSVAEPWRNTPVASRVASRAASSSCGQIHSFSCSVCRGVEKC